VESPLLRLTAAMFDPEETVISPQSMFEDPKLVTVFANQCPDDRSPLK